MLAPVRRPERQPTCLPYFELMRQDDETYAIAAQAIENIIKQAELVSSTKVSYVHTYMHSIHTYTHTYIVATHIDHYNDLHVYTR